MALLTPASLLIVTLLNARFAIDKTSTYAVFFTSLQCHASNSIELDLGTHTTRDRANIGESLGGENITVDLVCV